MKEASIRALMIAPGHRPHLTLLKNDLDSLQQAVSIGSDYKGYIEVLTLEEDVALLCNEEGKLIPLMGNRRIGDDIIAGVFYIVGCNDEGEFCSLSDDKAKKYAYAFWDPEDIPEDEVLNKFWIKFEEASEDK